MRLIPQSLHGGCVRFLKTILILALVGQLSLQAATYYVRTDGNNSNNGLTNTAGGAWLTLAKASSTIVGGDTVRVQPGAYPERVTETTSGTAGNYITYLADGSASSCQGFTISGASYVRIIGFEIFHTNTANSRGIRFDGTGSNNWAVGNYIHNTFNQGIGVGTPSAHSYLYIIGNLLTNIGIISGVSSNVTGGMSIAGTNGHHWLVEYNILGRVGDGMTLSGTNHIVRNNTILDFRNSYWNTTDSFHSDSWQAGSDGNFQNVKNHLYEANFTADQIELNSHVHLHQDQPAINGDTNILIRGEISANFGSGGIGVIGVGGVRAYNNTIYKLLQAGPGAIVIFYKGCGACTNYAYNGYVGNTLIYDRGLSTDALVLGSGVDSSTATFTNNLGYIAGTEPSYVSTNNPLLVNVTNYNFRISSPSSPAKGTGTSITWVTSASSSGTSFDVNNGQMLNDGYGMVSGDLITVGGVTTRITNIVGDTVTVSSSVIWTNLMPVYWLTDTTPDIGALPYESTELTSAILYQNGTTYTVVPTGDTRFVIFYVDGIPQTPDDDAPYTATFSSGVITAKAYALYAQAVPYVAATLVNVTSKAINYGTIRGNTTIR